MIDMGGQFNLDSQSLDILKYLQVEVHSRTIKHGSAMFLHLSDLAKYI